MEKLYGELIKCIIRAYRVNRYDNCPVNFFFSSCVIGTKVRNSPHE